MIHYLLDQNSKLSSDLFRSLESGRSTGSDSVYYHEFNNLYFYTLVMEYPELTGMIFLCTFTGTASKKAVILTSMASVSLYAN